MQNYADHSGSAQTVIDGLYVDDLSAGSQTVDKAFQLYCDTKECFAAGGFNLRK